MKKIKILSFCFVFLIVTLTSSPAMATRQINEQLIVDFGNIENGTIAVSVLDPDTTLRYKLKVEHEDKYYLYNLDLENEIVVPLQMGNGTYLIELYEQIVDNTYQRVGEFKVELNIDRKKVWLEPNVKVNFSSPERLISILNDITSPDDTETEIYKEILKYIQRNFCYDWLSATEMHAPEYADLTTVIDRRMGLCEELSALTVALFRLKGIQARLVIGKVDNRTHAWVEVIINGKIITYDPSFALYATKSAKYLPERYY